jgi:hypothetical protein
MITKNFEIGPFYGFIGSKCIWIRVKYLNYGLEIKSTKPLFSERNGYVKSIKLIFGWRLAFLKAKIKP